MTGGAGETAVGSGWVDVLVVAPDGASTTELPWADVAAATYDVEWAETVDAAVERLESGVVACVVVDGTGDAATAAIERVAAVDSRTTVFATYDGTVDDTTAGRLRAGADDLLPRTGGDAIVDLVRSRVDDAVKQRRTTRRAEVAYESHDALLAEASVPVLLVDADREVLHASDGARAYLGYDDVADIVGTDVASHVEESDRERALERFERVVEDVTSVPETELELETVDGEPRYAAVSTSPAHYDGDLVAQAVARDVTERYDPVRALARDDSVLPAALNVVDDVLFVIDADGDLRFWNDALSDTTGYDDAEIASMAPTDFFPPEAVDEAVAAVETTLETGKANLEAPLVTADGELVQCEFRSRALENDDGEVVGLVGVARTIEERRRRERALHTLNTVATELKASETPTLAAEQTVSAAAEVLDMEFCDVSLVDDAGTHLEVAAATEALDDDATMRMPVGEGVAGLTYRERESFLVDELDEFEPAEPHGSFHSLISVPVGDHGVFQAAADEAAAFDETDLELVELLAGHCATALDRIEREATLRDRTESLEAQNERLEEFASVVSHDLRNPLTLVQAEVEQAEASGDPESFDRVRDAISRMDALIDDLLSLARAGEGVSDVERVDLESTAVRCWGTVSASDGDLVLDDPGTVDADRTRLRQLLENLFRNSVEHGSTSNRTGSGDSVEHGSTSSRPEADDGVEVGAVEDGDVTVTVGGLDDGDGFYVADDGAGIPESERERVFESGYTTAETGTGFGLRIVEDVAEAHGWTVSVAESADGGARFEFRT